MNKTTHLAVDLGAESGRCVLGWIENGALAMRQVSRFDSLPVSLPSGLHTNAPALYSRIREAIDAATAEGAVPASLGVDTWGVDYGLLDQRGALLGLPFHYRDSRTSGILDRLFARVPREEVYAATGTQFMELNTLTQLLSQRLDDPASLDRAARLLCTPDLLNYWLTGRQAAEYTMAATTQCLNPAARTWHGELLQRLELPEHLFCKDIVMPGTRLGPAMAWGAGKGDSLGVEVVAGATHDTSAAVASAEIDTDTAWISSGTWSIMGVNCPEPVLAPAALEANITNEGAADGSIRLCKNIMGLWIVQECRRKWAAEGREYSYADLVSLAREAPADGPVVDPDHISFLRPGNMPEKLQAFCRSTGQPEPQGPGPVIRCALESIALRYWNVCETLESLIGRPLTRIAILGGGSQNELLNQMTADCCARPVIAGPAEATACGNLIIQMAAMGAIDGLSEGRRLVAAAFQPAQFLPRQPEAWKSKKTVFRQVIDQ